MGLVSADLWKFKFILLSHDWKEHLWGVASTWYKKMNDDDQRGHGEGERLHFLLPLIVRLSPHQFLQLTNNLYFWSTYWCGKRLVKKGIGNLGARGEVGI